MPIIAFRTATLSLLAAIADQSQLKGNSHVEQIRSGTDAEAKKIIVDNLHKVVILAKRYTNRSLELFDLVREGNQELIEAVEKGESAAYPRFPVYVTWCICRSIECAILKQSNPPNPYQLA